MSNVPDSSWISAIEKLDAWSTGALTCAFGIPVLLWSAGVAPFQQLPNQMVAFSAFVSVIAGALFAGRAAKSAFGAGASRKAPRLARLFWRLSARQKQFVLGVYLTGRRGFGRDDVEERWFEELRNWGWVECSPGQGSIDGPTLWSCALSELGWQEIQRAERLGNWSR